MRNRRIADRPKPELKHDTMIGAYVATIGVVGNVVQSQDETIVDIAGAERLASELDSAIAIEADVRDYEALEAAAAQTADAYGGIDVCFANAGIEVDGPVPRIPSRRLRNPSSGCLS